MPHPGVQPVQGGAHWFPHVGTRKGTEKDTVGERKKVRELYDGPVNEGTSTRRARLGQALSGLKKKRRNLTAKGATVTTRRDALLFLSKIK